MVQDPQRAEDERRISKRALMSRNKGHKGYPGVQAGAGMKKCGFPPPRGRPGNIPFVRRVLRRAALE